jgi:hypothetical protein
MPARKELPDAAYLKKKFVRLYRYQSSDKWFNYVFGTSWKRQN